VLRPISFLLSKACSSHSNLISIRQVETENLSSNRLKPSWASCWICLDDEADQYGKPPVRDCSCRGDDVGFAHLSGIVEYARRKSIEADTLDDLLDPWKKCVQCKQYFQDQLRIDLSNECKNFVEEKYPECDWHHLAVQSAMLREYQGRAVERKDRGDCRDKSICY
jgi:hypothetical protein